MFVSAAFEITQGVHPGPVIATKADAGSIPVPASVKVKVWLSSGVLGVVVMLLSWGPAPAGMDTARAKEFDTGPPAPFTTVTE